MKVPTESDQYTLYHFKRPTLLAFMGIPASGKTSLSKNIVKFLSDSKSYLECEESKYPEKIKAQFVDRDHFGYLDIYEYFRHMHIENLNAAYLRKQSGKSGVIDCYFEKVLFGMLEKKNIDWFINSKHADYPEILRIALKDVAQIQNADIVVFLKVSQEMHRALYRTRNRKADMNEDVFYSQDAFLAATQDYAKQSGTRLFIIEQENGIPTVTKKLLSLLADENLIEPD